MSQIAAANRVHDEQSMPEASDGDASVDAESNSGMSGVTDSSGTNASSTYGALKKETNTISVLRCLVITTLLTLAAIVSNIAFILALFKQEGEFETKFNAYSTKLVSGFIANVNVKYWIADTLVTEFTSTSKHLNVTWPNVSFRNFQERCSDARQLSSASALWIAPLVTQSDRELWEAYASEIHGSLQTDFEDSFNPHDFLIPRDTRWTDPKPYHIHDEDEEGLPYVLYLNSSRQVQQGIFRVEGGKAVTDEQVGPYFPIWQTLSSDTSRVEASTMFNQLSEPVRAEALTEMLEKEGAVLTRIFSRIPTEASIHQNYAGPTSALYYPIFDDFETKNIKAALTIEYDWGSFLQGILDAVDDPLLVVLENSCGEIHSFEVIGLQVQYLGEGDLHDEKVEGPSYNSTYGDLYFDLSQDLFEHVDENKLRDNGFVPAYGICQYRILVYPTQTFRDEYVTFRPTYIKASIAVIFLVTAAVFIIYDCLVERRQVRVMQSAKKTSAIVSALFPSQFRDRLMQGSSQSSRSRGKDRPAWKNAKGATKPAGGEGGSDIYRETPKRRLKSFLTSAPLHARSSNQQPSSEPIADLFTNTTVMYADIAGFTAWSSTREPSQVFVLLETLYATMDNGKFTTELIVCTLGRLQEIYLRFIQLPGACTCSRWRQSVTAMSQPQVSPAHRTIVSDSKRMPRTKSLIRSLIIF
jgi:hypothetical protein